MQSVSAQDSFEKQQLMNLHRLVNNYRTELKLGDMRLLQGLCDIAQVHAEDMASHRKGFSHDGFNDRVRQMQKRYNMRSYEAAENLFYTSSGANLAEQSLQAWIDSPGHHKNLKGNFKYSGIGIARDQAGGYYVVQLYLTD